MCCDNLIKDKNSNYQNIDDKMDIPWLQKRRRTRKSGVFLTNHSKRIRRIDGYAGTQWSSRLEILILLSSSLNKKNHAFNIKR